MAKIKPTKMGIVHIESKVTLDRIQELIFASDFTSHTQYRSIYTMRESLEFFAGKGGSVTLAILDNNIIIGFAVLDYPDARERWARLGKNTIIELKAVEVLREFRNHWIAPHLLSNLFSDSKLEQKIVYLIAYSWTWDIDYSGLSIQSYRDKLVDLYTDFGFIEYLTNEPNICLRPENIFMARVGKNISQNVREDFKWIRFGLSF
ncbi:MAG: hypothetical protein K8R67_09295 [Desulfobacteraceae bacterium]|nr:hypothetical protein [Desulfobacteraceae bacterium]